jgi:hypothetical protein
MKRIPLAIALLLAAGGLAITANSYTQLQGRTNLFTEGGIVLGDKPYQTFYVKLNLIGKYGATMSGYVGSVGCCVEFAILDNTSFSKWVSDPARNVGLPIVHLNSSVVKSQTAQGEFSFKVDADKELVLAFVNDEYPGTVGFKTHANLDLRYLSLTALIEMTGGLAFIALGALVSGLCMRSASEQAEAVPFQPRASQDA